MKNLLPIEHLSASSLTLHMRCPLQWQRKYLFLEKGTSNASLVIGSAFHNAIQRLNNGQPLGNYWQETVDAEETAIDWRKHTPESARELTDRMVHRYWDAVGRHFPPGGAEKEHLFEVEGLPLPVKAIIDKETPHDLFDYKTTAWFSESMIKRSGINKEWIVQQHIYQLKVPKPSSVHVITSTKNPVIHVPQNTRDPLYIGRADDRRTIKMLLDEYWRMQKHMEDFGYDRPWPGNPTHEFAYKYCQVEECCRL